MLPKTLLKMPLICYCYSAVVLKLLPQLWLLVPAVAAFSLVVTLPLPAVQPPLVGHVDHLFQLGVNIMYHEDMYLMP